MVFEPVQRRWCTESYGTYGIVKTEKKRIKKCGRPGPIIRGGLIFQLHISDVSTLQVRLVYNVSIIL